ncbi:hypothetical protein CU097_011211 [Rhizopus azygosporus]|uniref:Uncharacterized protein n=1 Tax=Rhizopus azygosporus TaxID=86630 RepID=A0A367JEE8_RHIAZ|nr:hypothetical protein CU097_011211 [Rhizopus azygosporus]
MKVLLLNLPDTIPKKMFCVRFFDPLIFFEELFMLKGNFYKVIHATFVYPTTPQLLKDFVQGVSKLFAWKQAVLSQTLKF